MDNNMNENNMMGGTPAPQPSYTPPQVPQQTPPMQESPAPKKGGMGPMIGAAIVVILLVAGALYYWQGTQMPANTSNDMSTASAEETDPYAADLQAASASMSTLDTETSADLNNLEQNF